jgi:rhodanese-related sulfurtransferase
MDSSEAKSFLAEHKEGTFTLLDVRQQGEYELSRIPGTKLIPLPELNDRLGELDPAKPTVVY